MTNSLPSFRDKNQVKALLEAIRRLVTTHWNIMEICGGQTHAIARYRLEELLPESLQLIHGPGCPVCVTPETLLDDAVAIATNPEVIFTTFGDMLRVPGSSYSLMQVKSQGADVRMVYSPLDAVKIARQNPHRQVVFFGIGFETTAPVNALSIDVANRLNLQNYSLLSSIVTVPPAIRMLKEDDDNQINALLAAGHVCVVAGYQPYHSLAFDYQMPISITGFEPADILWGIYNCVEMLETHKVEVRNAYPRMVKESGNTAALALMNRIFEISDSEWRGIGCIPQSGLRIRKEYELYDASLRFKIASKKKSEMKVCRSGDILKGRITPYSCPEFGHGCTPEHPLGASMVSSEGTCSAFYRYRPIIKKVI